MTPVSAPRTGGASLGSNTWLQWWKFNKERFLLGTERFPSIPRTGGEDVAGPRPPSVHEIETQVVPQLMEVLDSDPGDLLLHTVLLSLARIGGRLDDSLGRSDIAAKLTSYLDHPHRSVQENAITCLGVLAEPGSAHMLAQFLTDAPQARKLCKDYEVPARMRALAAYGLGLTGHRTQNPDVQQFVRTRLLRALDASDDVDIQVACVIGLGITPGFTPSEKVGRGLVDRFQDGASLHPLARAHAATTLARLHADASPAVRERITEALLDSLKSTAKVTNEVRQSAVLALGRIGDLDEDELDRKVRSTLMRTAVKGDLDARHFSLLALGEIGARRGNGQGNAVAGAADVRAFLLERLAKVKSQSRPWAALAAGILGRELLGTPQQLTPEEHSALRIAFDDSKSSDLVAAFSLSLGLAGNAESTALLAERLQEVSDPAVLIQGAAGLGLLADRRGTDSLRELLPEGKHDPELLDQTARSLERLEDTGLVAALVELLEDCNCGLSKASVARGLGRSRDARALSPLFELLSEGATELEQAWVAEALGQLCDRDELPWTSVLSTGINYLANPPSLTGPEGAGILDYL